MSNSTQTHCRKPLGEARVKERSRRSTLWRDQISKLCVFVVLAMGTSQRRANDCSGIWHGGQVSLTIF